MVISKKKEMMKIAHLEFQENPIFLAPMEDVTDVGFRLLCKQHGADMVYTEFVSSDALIRHVAKTKEKLTIVEEERPVAIQIYGNDPDSMAEAALICEDAKPDLIDLNFGCPAKKVAGRGAGSGILKTPDLMLEITERVVKAVKTPVTLKTRLGWDDNSKIIVELAERIQDCGVVALTIHGRTRAQQYKGAADWALIGDVKNNPRMHIPIIGNGDVDSGETARKRFEETGVDAVMVGRASFGRPWIFREIKHYLETGEELEAKPFLWYLDVLKQQIAESINRLDERRGILHNRRHLASSPIFKGIPDFRNTRIAMLRASTKEELFGILDGIAEEYGVE